MKTPTTITRFLESARHPMRRETRTARVECQFGRFAPAGESGGARRAREATRQQFESWG
jgi:hypothetical protein